MSWWEKFLREMVCLMIRTWGGDCTGTDGKTIAQLRAILAAHLAYPGPGPVGTLKEREDQAAMLAAHLSNPANDLSETDNAEAYGMLSDVYAALAAAGA